MPGFYERGRYDLAGFTVGVVDRRKMIDGRNVKEGDLLVGLASSGFHSNGFSLLRKVFSRNEILRNWRRFLLPPTRIYVKPILRILPKVRVKGIAHITGGGFFEKLVRVIPDGLGANIQLGSWPIPDQFQWVKKKGSLSLPEMFGTFNMGIGMVVIVSPGEVRKLSGLLKKDRLKHWIIGRMEKNQKSSKKVLIENGQL
jgi:phosphoribosylformylglycinamidine cyclo-ligase